MFYFTIPVTTEATICAQRFWYTPTGYCYCEYGGIRCYTNYGKPKFDININRKI